MRFIAPKTGYPSSTFRIYSVILISTLLVSISNSGRTIFVKLRSGMPHGRFVD